MNNLIENKKLKLERNVKKLIDTKICSKCKKERIK